MILFETDKKPLTYLLEQIENRDLALPDFQRSFVWDPGATRELVASIIRSFPAGSLLLMQGGGKIFAPRAFEEAPLLNGREPNYLVLDGQQRLTSLYQAFSGQGTHRFFLNLQELLDGLDVDEATEVYTAQRARRWESAEAQASDLMLPLSRMRKFADWKDEVLDLWRESTDDIRKLRSRLNELERDYVKPVELYQFPVTTLAASTPSEAVCTIFETLNRTGVKLSVFELITARAFAREVRLRDMWADARGTYPILQDFDVDPYYVLQAIAVAVRGSPKRSVVLAMDVDEIVEHWDRVVGGLAEALTFVRDECGVLVGKWLPYQTILVTMAAAWRPITDGVGPVVGARRMKMARWFWSSAFMGTYENSPNSTTERDVPGLLAWLQGGPEPTAVTTFSFDPERWRTVTPRQRALYRATIALLMRHSPMEFHEAMKLSKPIIDGKAVDDHHIFPRAYLARTGRKDTTDSVLNHTLIDRVTNIRIGARAPSDYLREMQQELGSKLSETLGSHGLPSDERGPLFQDRFEDFLDWRITHLTEELSRVTDATLNERGVLETPVTPGTAIEEEESPSRANLIGDLPRDVQEFLQARARDEASLNRLQQFISRLLDRPDVVATVGHSKHTSDGWARVVNLRRHGSQVGGFIYVFPSTAMAWLRLPEEDADGTRYARVRDVKKSQTPYRLRIELSSDESLAEALDLAQRAYEHTF